MKRKWALRFLIGLVLLAAYELLLDGYGVGMRAHWVRLKAWTGR